jgi:GDP-L-fucose synthase
MSNKFTNKKIFLAGKNGLLGSAIYKVLIKNENKAIILKPNSNELNLAKFLETDRWFKKNKPHYVILAAAKAGGILDNMNNPVNYMMDNIKIQTNVIECSYKYKIKKLIFIGSSCVYPKFSKNPIVESSLLEGKLEETNQWYAITKIHGIKMCQAFHDQFNCNFSSVMPCNLFGINDKFSDNNSHVIPALIKKFHNAKVKNKKKAEVWGSGKVKREFLFSEDCAKAIYLILKSNKYFDLINIGSGKDISIKNLSKKIKNIINYRGDIKFNKKMPDGVKKKKLDIKKIKKLGWKEEVSLSEGIKLVYSDFLKNHL